MESVPNLARPRIHVLQVCSRSSPAKRGFGGRYGRGGVVVDPGDLRVLAPAAGGSNLGPPGPNGAGPRPGTELAAGPHREHRRRSAVDDREAVVTLVAAGAAAVAATVRSEDEAGEEDHRDDEHHSCDDADPGGGGSRPGSGAAVRPGRSLRAVAGGVAATGPVAGSDEDVVGSVIDQILQPIVRCPS